MGCPAVDRSQVCPVTVIATKQTFHTQRRQCAHRGSGRFRRRCKQPQIAFPMSVIAQVLKVNLAEAPVR